MNLTLFAFVYYAGLFIIGLFPLIAGLTYVLFQTLKKNKIDWNHVIFMIILQICWFFGFLAYILKYILGM